MQQVGNPSSVHRHGRQARKLVEDAREQVARLVGADPANVFHRQRHRGERLGAARRQPGRVLVSAVEHASVLGSLDDTETIPVDADGLVRLDALEEMLADSDQPALISVMLANNETGVLQPIREIAMVARRYGALVHCDAVQAAGRIALDGAAQGVHRRSRRTSSAGRRPCARWLSIHRCRFRRCAAAVRNAVAAPAAKTCLASSVSEPRRRLPPMRTAPG